MEWHRADDLEWLLVSEWFSEFKGIDSGLDTWPRICQYAHCHSCWIAQLVGLTGFTEWRKKLRKCYPCTHYEDQRKKSKATKKNNKSKFGKKKRKGKKKKNHWGKEGTKGGGERTKMMTIDLTLYRASLVAQVVKNPPAMWETWVWSLGWEDVLEKGATTHSGMGSSSVDSNSLKYMGETFQKVLNNKTWICCAGN